MKAHRESSAPLKRVAMPQYGTYTSIQIQDLEHHFWDSRFSYGVLKKYILRNFVEISSYIVNS